MYCTTYVGIWTRFVQVPRYARLGRGGLYLWRLYSYRPRNQGRGTRQSDQELVTYKLGSLLEARYLGMSHWRYRTGVARE